MFGKLFYMCVILIIYDFYKHFLLMKVDKELLENTFRNVMQNKHIPVYICVCVCVCVCAYIYICIQTSSL